MASDLNKVLLMGRLTADPELRRIGSGTAVTELRLASNRSFQSRDGEKKEDVLYADVTVWDKGAENACQYLRKGSRVFVEGSLKLEQWDDKTTGEKRSKIKIQADPFGVKFLDSPNQGGGQQGGYSQRQETPQQSQRGGPEGRSPAPQGRGGAPQSRGGGGYAGQGPTRPMTQAEVDDDSEIPFLMPLSFNDNELWSDMIHGRPDDKAML